jgi:hypothetical protein
MTTTHHEHVLRLYPYIETRKAELLAHIERLDGYLECEIDLFGGRTAVARDLRHGITNLKKELEGIEQLLTPDTQDLGNQ